MKNIGTLSSTVMMILMMMMMIPVSICRASILYHNQQRQHHKQNQIHPKQHQRDQQHHRDELLKQVSEEADALLHNTNEEEKNTRVEYKQRHLICHAKFFCEAEASLKHTNIPKMDRLIRSLDLYNSNPGNKVNCNRTHSHTTLKILLNDTRYCADMQSNP